MLKHLAFCAVMSGVILNAYAIGPGLYLGLKLGPATNTGSEVQVQVQGPPPGTTLGTPRSQQFGSSLFAGYMINPYVGFEGGLDYFNGIQYDTKGVDTCSSSQARIRDFTATVKGVVPVYAVSAYGKAGAALVYQSTSGDLTPNLNDECGKTTYITKFRPTFSIGASYDFNQNWQTDISWNRIMVNSPINNVDFYALGLSYHFVDKYCGQFLCDD